MDPFRTRAVGGVGSKNSYGPTILIACANMRCGWFELLVDWGADSTATYEDKTAVEWIVYRAGYAEDSLQQTIDNAHGVWVVWVFFSFNK